MSSASKDLINDVSDTAFWVAKYRAEETQRVDSLFKDPFAERLAGAKGQQIAKGMFGSQWTRWTITVRTAIIDQILQNLIATDVDVVVNLGAGLDARPYRMQFKKNIDWIEVDFPKMIDYKSDVLKAEKPKSNLERVSLDLTKRSERQKFLFELNRKYKNILILTEGVIPYLDESAVNDLCEDLKSQPHIKYWITEYMSSKVYSYFRKKRRQQALKNSPFKFMPENWFGFFKARGWSPAETIYLGEAGDRLNRPPPFPWWGLIFRMVLPKSKLVEFKRLSAYMVLIRSTSD